ncbi:MAG TPA: DinB family protein [Thermoanaerobaculia bacterium]|nr:DinB family protein [Thermoanaerobaculia bacterium]
MVRDHARALHQLALMAELAQGPAPELAARAPAVSGWSVAEHLEHLVLADRAVLKSVGRILDDRQAPAAPNINLLGRVVLGTGFMPRGRARTTPAYEPAAMPQAALHAAILENDRGLRELAPRLGELERSGGRSRHLRFGGLGGRQWLRFLVVHHHHHLKIVRDIRRQRRARGLAAVGLPSR